MICYLGAHAAVSHSVLCFKRNSLGLQKYGNGGSKWRLTVATGLSRPISKSELRVEGAWKR